MGYMKISCAAMGAHALGTYLELDLNGDKFTGKYQESNKIRHHINELDIKSSYQSFELATNEVITILKILNAPMKPVPWEMNMGFDGTFYRLNIQNGYNEVTFNWWVEAPKEWRGAENVLRKLMALAERELKAQDS